jgi:hypothetical protein
VELMGQLGFDFQQPIFLFTKFARKVFAGYSTARNINIEYDNTLLKNDKE